MPDISSMPRPNSPMTLQQLIRENESLKKDNARLQSMNNVLRTNIENTIYSIDTDDMLEEILEHVFFLQLEDDEFELESYDVADVMRDQIRISPEMEAFFNTLSSAMTDQRHRFEPNDEYLDRRSFAARIEQPVLVHLAQNGYDAAKINQIWHELAAKYPEVFFR